MKTSVGGNGTQLYAKPLFQLVNPPTPWNIVIPAHGHDPNSLTNGTTTRRLGTSWDDDQCQITREVVLLEAFLLDFKLMDHQIPALDCGRSRMWESGGIDLLVCLAGWEGCEEWWNPEEAKEYARVIDSNLNWSRWGKVGGGEGTLSRGRDSS